MARGPGHGATEGGRQEGQATAGSAKRGCLLTRRLRRCRGNRPAAAAAAAQLITIDYERREGRDGANDVRIARCNGMETSAAADEWLCTHRLP